MRDPISDIIELFDEAESLVASLWEFNFPSEANIWSPATDVFVARDEVYVIVEVPGVERQNLKIAISPVLLEVSGRRQTPESFRQGTSFYELEIPHGVFRKRIALPSRVEPRRVRATLKDGLLTLRLPCAASQKSKST